MKEKIRLSGVPETMLQTVYARAKESRGRGAIHDAKAEEIIEKLDYDFSLADKDTAMHSGVIARTIVLDRLTKAWLSAHPGAVVVNIACGLDTRCYRMKGFCHWYNLDLPETMAVREKLLPESGTISQIAMSAMEDWGSKISEQRVVLEHQPHAAILRRRTLRPQPAPPAAGPRRPRQCQELVHPAVRQRQRRHPPPSQSADGDQRRLPYLRGGPEAPRPRRLFRPAAARAKTATPPALPEHFHVERQRYPEPQ